MLRFPVMKKNKTKILLEGELYGMRSPPLSCGAHLFPPRYTKSQTRNRAWEHLSPPLFHRLQTSIEGQGSWLMLISQDERCALAEPWIMPDAAWFGLIWGKLLDIYTYALTSLRLQYSTTYTTAIINVDERINLEMEENSFRPVTQSAAAWVPLLLW